MEKNIIQYLRRAMWNLSFAEETTQKILECERQIELAKKEVDDAKEKNKELRDLLLEMLEIRAIDLEAQAKKLSDSTVFEEVAGIKVSKSSHLTL